MRCGFCFERDRGSPHRTFLADQALPKPLGLQMADRTVVDQPPTPTPGVVLHRHITEEQTVHRRVLLDADGVGGVAVVEIEGQVLHGEVGPRVHHNGVVGGILHRQVGYAEITDVVEEHDVAQVVPLIKLSRVDGVGVPVPIVEVPDPALDLEVVAGVLRRGGVEIVELPNLLVEGKEEIPQSRFGLEDRLVLKHEAVGAVGQLDLGVAGELQLEA